MLEGFDTPFSQNLDINNRWVVLAKAIPWDSLTNIYSKQLNNKMKGADGINPRVVIGSLIIKHMCDLSDRETINAIQENIYMQYFIGYSSFSNEAPFDPSLFVGIRKPLLSVVTFKSKACTVLSLPKKRDRCNSGHFHHSKNSIFNNPHCCRASQQ